MSLLTPPAQTSPHLPRSPATAESPLVGWVRRHIPSWAGSVLLVVAGLLFFWPAIRSDFTLDDYVHASMVAGTYPADRAPYDLYNLVDDTSRAPLLERGLLPWWTHPQLTIRFFRPLASLLRWADYSLLGNHALAHHAHSFLWWIAAAFGARALFRRLLPARAAAIATVIFALSPCHSIPLVWLANREALVSLAFGLPALLAYVRWREEKSARAAALAALLFAGSLAAGEYALAFTGYVAAFELVRRGDGVGRRALGLLPFVLPTAAYVALRTWLRYGSFGSGFYADPLNDPETFLHFAPGRLTALLLDGWFALDRETFFASLWQTFFAGFAIAGLVLVAVAIRPTYRALEAETRAHVRWLLIGSTLSLAPMLAVVPSGRLVGASLIGIAAVVGLVVDRAWFSPGREGLRGVASFAALALAFVHLVHGPASSWLTGRAYRESTQREADHRTGLRARLDPLAYSELVVVRGGPSAPFHLPFSLDPVHNDIPARFAVLSQTGHALAIRRGPSTLELIAAQDDTLIPLGEANIYLDMRRKFTVGEVIPMPWGHATILALAHERPRIVSFEFDHDLDASRLVWVSETTAAFTDARPPGIGMGMPFDP